MLTECVSLLGKQLLGSRRHLCDHVHHFAATVLRIQELSLGRTGWAVRFIEHEPPASFTSSHFRSLRCFSQLAPKQEALLNGLAETIKPSFTIFKQSSRVFTKRVPSIFRPFPPCEIC